MRRLAYPGAVDADGHILEAPDLWEQYLEPRYRERALRLRTDAQGLEYLEINGAPSKVGARRHARHAGRHGAEPHRRAARRPSTPTSRGASFGAMDARERLQRLDQEGLATRPFSIPPSACSGRRSAPMRRSRRPIRARTTAGSSTSAPTAAAGSFPSRICRSATPRPRRRSSNAPCAPGARGGWVAPFTMTKKPHGHPDHDRLFAAAQDLDVPLAIHPTFEPKWATPGRFEHLHGAHFFLNVTAADAVRHAFTSFFQFAVFDRFPRLKLVVLESGAGWIGYWLDRMDGYAASLLGRAVPLKEKPSTLLPPPVLDLLRSRTSAPSRRSWSCTAPTASSGPRTFRTPITPATTSPSWKSWPDKLPPAARPQLLGENVRRCYGVADGKTGNGKRETGNGRRRKENVPSF